MFSCLLLHSGSESEPIVARKCDVNAQVVGLVGRGKARVSYTLEKDCKNLVLYVPSLMAHRDATRQQVRLVDCKIQVDSTGGEVRAHSLRLDASEYSSCGRSLPEYASLKRRYKDLLTAYFGAHSCEDVLLYLGDLPSGCGLSAHFEFLIKFTSATSTSSLQRYLVCNRLPTQSLSYQLNLASPLRVEDVSPVAAAAYDVPALNWTHLSDTNRNVVQISYEYLCPSTAAAAEMQMQPAYSSGFAVKLAEGVSMGCCCGLISENGRHRSDWDGIMMLNDTFSRRQLPAHMQQKPLFPSEFVFVIDCSGSMSGTNIQSAADTLITCVKSLPKGCYFNVIAFGSTFRQLFHTSTEYSKKSMERAVQFANQLQASLGGTELLQPLHWVFKKPRCSSLPCQVFIITDGGVTNTQKVIHTVRKNRYQARCHTFGIGPEVCTELVTGIAAASGGRCTLLAEGERLQSKVMDVLKESLQPTVMDTVLRWEPPVGYSVVDSTPRNLGTLYSGSCYAAFAFLSKNHGEEEERLRMDEGGMAARLSDQRTTKSIGSATIAGTVGGEDVEIRISQAMVPELTEVQSSELSSILAQTALWSKLCDLEARAFSSSRKNSQDDNDRLQQPPSAKKLKLNGLTAASHHGACGSGLEDGGRQPPSSDQALREELVELSLESGIPCALTYFRDVASTGGRGPRVTQLLPYPHNPNPTPKKHPENGSTAAAFQYQQHLQHLLYRKRKHAHSQNHHRHNHKNHHHYGNGSPADSSLSLTSVAKSSISAVGSTLKSVVNMATFGLLCHDEDATIENGRRIDDELEYQRTKDSRLHWDEAKGHLVYPNFYYNKSNHRSQTPSASTSHSKRKSQKATRHVCLDENSSALRVAVSANSSEKQIHHHHHHHPKNGFSTNSHHTPLVPNGSTIAMIESGFHVPQLPQSPGLASDNSDGEEDDFAISDSESDSSVDPDWDDLHRPNELLPLIHMQLFSGAWPIVRAFSYAVGVPLEEIRKLPMKAPPPPATTSTSTSVPLPVASPNRRSSSSEDCEDETKAHFWTTALAIACLEEFFVSFQPEWELVALKGRCWLQENSHLTDQSLAEVRLVARELILRQSKMSY